MTFTSALLLAVAIGMAGAVRAGELNLDVDLRSDGYGEAVDGSPRAAAWILLEPRATVTLSNRVSLSFKPVFELDSEGAYDRRHFYRDNDRAIRPPVLRIDELKLHVDLGSIDLDFGKQKLAWGRTDGVNPTDNLTPRDWTDPLDETRLSPWAARAGYEQDRWSGELAVVPRYSPSRLPELQERWFRLPGTARNPGFPFVGPKTLRLDYRWDGARFPKTTFTNVSSAVKGGYRGSFLEWTLSYYRGFDDAPRVRADTGAIPLSDLATGSVSVPLSRAFRRLEVTGFDGVAIAGAWAFRGEGGYFHFPEGRDDGYLLAQVEAEWTHAQWSAIAGYAGTFGDAPNPGAASGVSGGSGNITRDTTRTAAASNAFDTAFLPAVFLHVARAVPTEWQAAMEAAYGIDRHDSLIRLSGSWPANDHLRVGAEADVLSGPSGSFFGSWRDNDRLRFWARLSF